MFVTQCKVSVSRCTAREDRRYRRKQAVARKLRFLDKIAWFDAVDDLDESDEE